MVEKSELLFQCVHVCAPADSDTNEVYLPVKLRDATLERPLG